MRVRIGVDVGGTKIEGIVLYGSDEIGRIRVATRHAAEQQLTATFRVGLMRAQDGAPFPNWDQDATAVDDPERGADPLERATVVAHEEQGARADSRGRRGGFAARMAAALRAAVSAGPSQPAGVRKRSESEYFGIPLWEIATGPNPERGERRGRPGRGAKCR